MSPNNNENRESPKARLQRLKDQLAKLEQLEALKAKSADEANSFQLRLRDESKFLDGSQALPFRTALEQEPALVSRIRNNLAWLRVVMLIYGGLNDLGIANYFERFTKLRWLLGIQDKGKRRMVLEKLRQETWWKEKWNTREEWTTAEAQQDIFYELAVYLDTEGGALAKPMTDIAPVFEAALIYSDSPLTPLFLQALRDRASVQSLSEPLWKRWKSEQDPLTRAHALLTLLLIDSQRAIQTLRAEISAAPASDVIAALLNHIQSRQHSLHGVLLLLANQGVGEALQPLYSTLPEAQFSDLVGLLFEVCAAANFTTVKPDSFLLDLKNALPYVSAEVWMHWLSCLNDDAQYSAGVVFDTIGAKTRFTFALSNLHQARNARFNQVTNWSIEPIPPLLTDEADLFGYGLTVIQQSKTIIELVFQAGLTVFLGAKKQEIPGLFEEACAMALTLPPATTEYVLGTLLGQEYTEERRAEWRLKIVEQSFAIADPVIRARSLWRLTEGNLVLRGRDVWQAIISAAEEIAQPLQRSLAFERLIVNCPLRYRQQMQDKAERAAYQIADADNRARALTRLSRYRGGEEWRHLLRDAVESVGHIADARARVETALLVHSQLTPNDALWSQLDTHLSSIDDEWLTLKSQNLLSLKLLESHSKLRRAAFMTPVVLSALLADVNALALSKQQTVDYWDLLCHPETYAEAQRQLTRQAAEDEVGALPLTAPALKAITTLLESGEIAKLYPLLPYLRARGASLPTLRRWVETRPDAELWRYACLMLAEHGQLDVQTLPGVTEILEHGVDLGRARASLALHGDTVIVGKHDRQYRSSQLGFELQYQLAQTRKRLLSQPRLSSPIRWAFYNIAFDDEAVFHQTVSALQREHTKDSPAYGMLSSIDLLDPSLYNTFFQAFIDGDDIIRGALLKSWIFQLRSGSNFGDKNFRVPPEYVEQTEEALQHMTPDALEDIRVIPNRAMTIAGVIAELINAEIADDPSALLRGRSWVYPEKTLKDINEHCSYAIDADAIFAREAATQIAANPKGVKLLFTWLANMLRENVDDTGWYYERATLLEVAAIVASLSPAAAFTLIRDLEMEDLITRAAILNGWFCGRAGAAALMGYFIHIPENFVDVLIECIQDVPQVQTNALHMVRSLRYFDPQLAPQLIKLLTSKSASIAYAAIQILTAIGRNNKCPQAIRRDILGALAELVNGDEADRGVFVFEEEGAYMFIRCVTTFQSACFKAIMDITNL